MSVRGRYDVLAVANPFYDRTVDVPEGWPESRNLVKGSTTVVSDLSVVDAFWKDAKKIENTTCTLGGSGANVANALARFEHKCKIIGNVGNDGPGEKIEKTLKQIGITSLLTKGNCGTGIVNCFITPDAERTMQTYVGASAEFSEKDIVADSFQNVKHVHLEGYLVYCGKALETAITHAKTNWAKISLDLASTSVVERFKSCVEACASHVNYVFGNLQEIKALTNAETAQEAVEYFDTEQTIVVTIGDKGCWVKAKGDSDAVHYAAHKVAGVIDTTGAGDFFDAGFLHGELQGKTVAQSAQMGHLAASFVIQQKGAELPPDQWEALKQRMTEL